VGHFLTLMQAEPRNKGSQTTLTTATPRSHWAALLLPVALPAASDGWTWRKRPHWQRYTIDPEDELTDEEQASEGEDFDD
jgi:hypothetical protein